MIEYRCDPGGEFVELMIDGGLSRAEFDALAGQLERAIAAHGKVRLLEEIRSLGAVEPSVFWADAKWALRHLNDFSRCAVVTDKVWIEWLTKAVDPLTACELRHFPPDQIEDARRWLREDFWANSPEQA